MEQLKREKKRKKIKAYLWQQSGSLHLDQVITLSSICGFDVKTIVSHSSKTAHLNHTRL